MIQINLCLSSAGDSLELNLITDRKFRKVDFQTDAHHVSPSLRTAREHKTHEAVLAFLRGLQGNECQFSHSNNSEYPRHEGSLVGRAHQCSLERMIEFVEMKIKEKSVPYPRLNRIKRIASRILFEGLIPIKILGSAMVGVVKGVAFMVAAVALAILSVLPNFNVFDKDQMRARRDAIFAMSMNHLTREGFCKITNLIMGVWANLSLSL